MRDDNGTLIASSCLSQALPLSPCQFELNPNNLAKDFTGALDVLNSIRDVPAAVAQLMK